MATVLTSNKVDFSSIIEPGLLAMGQEQTLIKSVEICNTTEEDAEFEIVRIDTEQEEYMLVGGSIEAGNYAVPLACLNIPLDNGHKLVARSENTELKITANILNIVKEQE